MYISIYTFVLNVLNVQKLINLDLKSDSMADSRYYLTT